MMSSGRRANNVRAKVKSGGRNLTLRCRHDPIRDPIRVNVPVERQILYTG